MHVRTRRLTLGAVTVVAVFALAACQGSTSTTSMTPTPTVPTPSVVASPTTAPATSSTSPSHEDPLPLSTAETAWVNSLNKLNETLGNALVSGAITKTRLLATASVLNSCSSGLARLGRPTDRLMPTLKIVQTTCAEFEEAAKCAKTAAAYVNSYSNRGQRKLTSALDCLDSRMNAAGKTLGDTIIKAYQLQ